MSEPPSWIPPTPSSIQTKADDSPALIDELTLPPPLKENTEKKLPSFAQLLNNDWDRQTPELTLTTIPDDKDEDYTEFHPKQRKTRPLSSSDSEGKAPFATNKKISHSLIEKRRREKINDCLSRLHEIVPQCHEEQERKEERARKRGRKRARKDDGEAPRGGLHKLEILQSTIAYIDELRIQVLTLQTQLEASVNTSALRREREESDSTIYIGEEMPIPTSHDPSVILIPHTPSSDASPGRKNKQNQHDRASEEVDTATGLLLLRFSNSPKLRPILN